VGFGGRGPGVGVWNETCDRHLKAGGWCSPRRFAENIPAKNVYIFNNLVVNEDGWETAGPHFGIPEPVQTPAGSNLPGEVRADDGLLIRGNVIRNGLPGHPVIAPAAGAAPAGNDEQGLRRHNSINRLKPRLVDPEHGDYRPVRESLAGAEGCVIPDFSGGDLPLRPRAPQGELSNQPSCDRCGKPRTGNRPGAWQ